MDVEVNEEGQLKVVFDEELEKFRKELSAERNKINSFFNQRKYKFENELTKIEENAYKNAFKDEKLKGIAEEVFEKYITKFIREMFGENVQDLRQFGFRFVDFQNFIFGKFFFVKALKLREKYGNFTYLNVDVEGAEKEVLEGSKTTLQLDKPKICMAAYHRSEDIFALINLINKINGDYKIYLRHHPHISFWDTNIYCI
jgi:hypothetical protein